MWEKIKNWFKKNWGYFAAAIGGFVAALLTRLCGSRKGRLEQDKQLCDNAQHGITGAKDSIGESSNRIKSADDTIGKLKTSIESSKHGVGESINTIDDLIRDVEYIETVTSKYGKGN